MSDTALKLTAYFAERERIGDRFLAEAMFELFADRRVATSVMLRGISGFGQEHILRSDQSLTLSEDPSVAIAAVDDAATIGPLVGDVVGMTTSGLITVERARLLDGDVTAMHLPDDSIAGDAVKLTVYVGRNRRVGGVPAWVRPRDRAIEKQVACAAAISSSGLVTPFGSSARAGHETG